MNGFELDLVCDVLDVNHLFVVIDHLDPEQNLKVGRHCGVITRHEHFQQFPDFVLTDQEFYRALHGPAVVARDDRNARPDHGARAACY